MNTTPIKEALQWRYATSVFDTTKTVSEDTLNYILEAANLMPTSYGLQPFRMIVVKDVETRNKLVEHSYGQQYVADNSHLIVLAARTDIDEAMIAEYASRIESVRELPAGTVDGFKDMMVGDLTNRAPEARTIWAQKQAYIALGGLMAAASEVGVDNHALEGFNAEAYDEILGLQDKNLKTSVILAIGYRSEEDQTQHYKKVRLPMEEMVITI